MELSIFEPSHLQVQQDFAAVESITIGTPLSCGTSSGQVQTRFVMSRRQLEPHMYLEMVQLSVLTVMDVSGRYSVLYTVLRRWSIRAQKKALRTSRCCACVTGKPNSSLHKSSVTFFSQLLVKNLVPM